MKKFKPLGKLTLVFLVLIMIVLLQFIYEHPILSIIIVFGIVYLIIVMVFYSYEKDKEEEKRAISQALIEKRNKQKQAAQKIKQEQEAKRVKQEQETQRLHIVKQLENSLSKYLLERKKKNMLVSNNIIFENKELIKAILDNNINITIDAFFKKILLCDKLKKHNVKYVFDDYILLFNGYYIKFCKIENLNVSADYIDMSSHCFNYRSNPSFSPKYGTNKDSICIGKNGFIRYEFFISKENREILEKHINETLNDIYIYRDNIDTFIDLNKFDYENFFENETMNKITEALIKDVHFYNKMKNENFIFLDKTTLPDYYYFIELKNKYKEWKDERERLIHQLLHQLNMLYEEKYTADNSVLFCKLVELNQKYINEESVTIAQVCKQHIFQIECKSKTEFDRFDFNKKVIEEIRKNTFYYYSFPEVIKEAENNYECYIEKYNNLKKSYSVKKNNYNFEIDYTHFKFNENKLFKKNNMIPPIYPTMQIELHYTTPSLRHSYGRIINFEYEEILTLIEKSKEPSKSEVKKQEIKKLRDKVKLLEEQIKQMQQGQIYSIQQVEQSKATTLQQSNSISTSLTYYRTLFENGEISREEYEQKRKELMG